MSVSYSLNQVKKEINQSNSTLVNLKGQNVLVMKKYDSIIRQNKIHKSKESEQRPPEFFILPVASTIKITVNFQNERGIMNLVLQYVPEKSGTVSICALSPF